MFNRLLRYLGLKVHVWKNTHRSGSEKQCIHCGERKSEYVWWVQGPEITWWETSSSGDGSCKHGTPELPTKIY